MNGRVMEFYNKLSEYACVSPAQARRFHLALVRLIADELKQQRKVTLPYFGVFEVRRLTKLRRIRPIYNLNISILESSPIKLHFHFVEGFKKFIKDKLKGKIDLPA